jgi:hypothetical protein
VGFFVQFADPENANFRLIASQGLSLIPVASDETRPMIRRTSLTGSVNCRLRDCCRSQPALPESFRLQVDTSMTRCAN